LANLGCHGSFGGTAYAPAYSAEAPARVFAKAAHAFAELFPAASDTPAPDVLAQALAASSGRQPCSLEGSTNAPPSSPVGARPPPPRSRHGENPAFLIIAIPNSPGVKRRERLSVRQQKSEHQRQECDPEFSHAVDSCDSIYEGTLQHRTLHIHSSSEDEGLIHCFICLLNQ
jgi:hypothetical protein